MAGCLNLVGKSVSLEDSALRANGKPPAGSCPPKFRSDATSELAKSLALCKEAGR